MQLIKLIILLLLMAVGVVLTVLNSESVVLNYYFGSRELPLSVVLVAAVAFGALLGLVASLGGFFRLKRQNSELRRKAQLASQEINNLRAIPIKD
ncbi:MAG: LapA family protein [Sedimenticola sp.]